MWVGVVAAESGTWQPASAPAVMSHENAFGAFNPPPPPVTKAIGCPSELTPVNRTFPAAIGVPEMLRWLAVTFVNVWA
jgi:hypothetical protein